MQRTDGSSQGVNLVRGGGVFRVLKTLGGCRSQRKASAIVGWVWLRQYGREVFGGKEGLGEDEVRSVWRPVFGGTGLYIQRSRYIAI